LGATLKGELSPRKGQMREDAALHEPILDNIEADRRLAQQAVAALRERREPVWKGH